MTNVKASKFGNTKGVCEIVVKNEYCDPNFQLVFMRSDYLKLLKLKGKFFKINVRIGIGISYYAWKKIRILNL